MILNNTLINRFMILSFKREANIDAMYEAPISGGNGEFLSVVCSGVQRDHEVQWRTDNVIVGNAGGVVNCDPRPNSQQILSNYSSRLESCWSIGVYY